MTFVANKDDIKRFNDEINGIKPDIENNSDFQCYHKPCTFCVLGFQTKDSMKTHVEKVHGLTKLNLKEEKSENIVCNCI